MAKKRQQDFVKTQLKPGRNLTKRKNANPSVKAKKLIIPKKSDGSPKSIQTILESLNSSKSHKLSLLQQLAKMVDSAQVNFFITETFECVAKFILDLDTKVRDTAVEVLKKIFEKKNFESLKTKISSSSPLLINVLQCGITSTGMNVKRSTLDLLTIILAHHPDLICNSLVILNSFNDLIDFRKLSHSTAFTHGKIDFQAYKFEAFDTLSLFLKEMLKNFEKDEYKNEQEIYWNCEGPLYLEIYAGGGLKPVDIEKSAVDNLNFQAIDFDDPSFSEKFLTGVFSSIHVAFREEIPSQIKHNGNLPHTAINNLNRLMRVLCQITELVQLASCDKIDQNVRKFLLEDILKQKLFPFYPAGYLNASSCQNDETTSELNLAVCFLYSRFLLQDKSGKDIFNNKIMTYMKSVFQMNYNIKKDSIPMILKILEPYYSLTYKNEISEFLIDTLEHISVFLGKGNGRSNKHKVIDAEITDILFPQFSKLSLIPNYGFLINTVAMKNWFASLLIQLRDIPTNGIINKNLLRVTKIIANRKYPFFLNELALIDDSSYKALLKYDDPDVRDTVIFLIYNMETISGSLLETISNVILLDKSFPTHYAVRFIRLLTCRFTEKHEREKDFDISSFRRGQEEFIQFLLNVAVDSLSVTSNTGFDFEANDCIKSLEPFKDVIPYVIFPSLHWKEHSELFDVCQKSLNLLPQKLVTNIMKLMFKELLNCTTNLPMHSTIAILKLNHWEIKDRHYHFHMYDLIFSSLFTVSVLTNITIEDEWYKYNVIELVENLKLNGRIAQEALRHQIENIGELNDITFYHIARICKFYIDEGLVSRHDSDRVLEIMESFRV